MNSVLKKALIVTLLHLALVLSVGGKLLYDRTTRPRVWVRTASYDPDLPIRGRYITLNLEVNAPWYNEKDNQNDVKLSVVNGKLIATQTGADTGLTVSKGWLFRSSTQTAILNPQLAFFIPEHAEIGFNRRSGDELWAEVTIPKKGPPRPIQLAIKNGKEWKPLDLK